jgi:hypothetical protein
MVLASSQFRADCHAVPIPMVAVFLVTAHVPVFPDPQLFSVFFV